MARTIETENGSIFLQKLNATYLRPTDKRNGTKATSLDPNRAAYSPEDRRVTPNQVMNFLLHGDLHAGLGGESSDDGDKQYEEIYTPEELAMTPSQQEERRVRQQDRPNHKKNAKIHEEQPKKPYKRHSQAKHRRKKRK